LLTSSRRRRPGLEGAERRERYRASRRLQINASKTEQVQRLGLGDSRRVLRAWQPLKSRTKHVASRPRVIDVAEERIGCQEDR